MQTSKSQVMQRKEPDFGKVKVQTLQPKFSECGLEVQAIEWLFGQLFVHESGIFAQIISTHLKQISHLHFLQLKESLKSFFLHPTQAKTFLS